ncbi:MAG: zinc metalloprotease [Thermoanaerobaculia bacterium]
MAAKKRRSSRTKRAAQPPLRRSCGTMAVHFALLEKHPAFHARLFRLEEANQRRRTLAFAVGAQPLAKIKVVVHVVHKTAEQNISDAQIKSQMKVLNQDFRATNPDRNKTPAPFKGFVSDTRVQFVLSKVTRTRTTKTSFGSDDGVKKAATGGIPPVNPKKYLNVWVCPLSGGLLGYAQFPGGPPATDGVVINYRAFGTMGTAQAPFNKGRTAVHEVGHYLNLRHIWGDTEDCSGGDLVADTPNAETPNYGKPRFPSTSCGNGPNGDMFMNYMDYVDDDAMHLFTVGQVARMHATLDGPRKGIEARAKRTRRAR